MNFLPLACVGAAFAGLYLGVRALAAWRDPNADSGFWEREAAEHRRRCREANPDDFERYADAPAVGASSSDQEGRP